MPGQIELAAGIGKAGGEKLRFDSVDARDAARDIVLRESGTQP